MRVRGRDDMYRLAAESDSRNAGFTLLEAIIAFAILGIGIAAMSALYSTGLTALDVQGERAMLDSALRSRMERLLSEDVDQLVDGTDTVVVGCVNYPVTWVVVGVDLDGDTVDEVGVKSITVTMGDASLTTMVVDNTGQVEKL
jgi:Prokaryotic N-terminal methylation motif